MSREATKENHCVDSTATTSGNILAMTHPLASIALETGFCDSNDSGVAPHKQHLSADEALEMAGSIMARMFSGESRRGSLVLVDDVYASEDDGGVGTNKSDSRRHSSMASSGRWTREEHEAFLQGLKEHGREWKKVAEKIQTRNSAQVRCCRRKKQVFIVCHAVDLVVRKLIFFFYTRLTFFLYRFDLMRKNILRSLLRKGILIHCRRKAGDLKLRIPSVKD